MAIREFSPEGVHRLKVAFFNELPEESIESRFKERGFVCIKCTESELTDPSFVSFLDAVVFSQRPEKRTGLNKVLETVPLLLNNDVRVYIRMASDPERTSGARDKVVDTLLRLQLPMANITPEEWSRIPDQRREREKAFLAPYVYLVDASADWSKITHVICDRPAGGTPNTAIKINGSDYLANGDLAIHRERLLLIQRAFHDCDELHVEPMIDGLSGAPVFKVYAKLQHAQGALPSNWPYLYFVKLGPRKTIADEYDKYVGRAIHHVPFHLGPRLRLGRCNLGTSQGILVGDFVEGAESIRDCASAGRAGHAIANLFDKTLGPWRKQAHHTKRSLKEYLGKKWLTKDGQEIALPPKRAEIVRQLGGIPDVAPLRKVFEQIGDHAGAICGPAHGDLHAANVLVRNGDAIIIDFEKMEDEFPMLYDPASLESGLVMDGFVRDKRAKNAPEELLELIRPLYTGNALIALTVPYHAANPASWLFDCAAQIRTLSRHAESTAGQYALVLALCLIRKGCNPDPFEPINENLRAISFVLGQSILLDLASMLTVQARTVCRNETCSERIA
ncbi:hypothetical protein [Ferribacterium limneticum]|uniref:hypothetical protein n=1 Tax=Ferribacterium limneticum TaxID=76259 RepID=UPI001CF8407A|nr:hypothetical protein [Ferribacterium limneticum]UCV21501.1 phosphotransferase [Ferribacterium limneticum]